MTSGNPFFRRARRRRVDTRVAEQAHREVLSPKDRLPTLAEIATPENLFAAYSLQESNGGDAPGADLITYSMLSPTEVRAMTRRLSRLLTAGEYFPSPDRPSSVPKDYNSRRPIQIAAVADHVVGKAIYEAIKWRLDRLMSPAAHAYRPNRGPLTAFAAIERQIVENEWYWIITADIQKAYENVNIDLLLSDFRDALEQDGTLEHDRQRELFIVIERILRGARRTTNKGIGQGNHLANPAFNIHISKRHDSQLATLAQGTAHIRYSDNLAQVGGSSCQAELAHSESGRLLGNVGLRLKDDTRRACLLEGGSAEVLGLEIRYQEDNVRCTVAASAWKRLEEDLDACYGHEHLSPNEAAAMTATGWLGYLGPCLREGTEDTLTRLRERLTRRGFGDVPADELRAAVERAIRTWEQARNVVLREGVTTPAPAGRRHNNRLDDAASTGDQTPVEAPF